MSAAQTDELTVVVELVGIGVLEIPVDSVDRVGRLVGVVHAAFVAEEFFAGEHEGSALRGEHDGLSQTSGTLSLLFGGAGHGGGELIGEHEVIVARHVVDDHLGRGGVGNARGVAEGEVHLGVIGGSYDADFDGFFIAGFAGGEAAVVGAGVVTFDAVADVVGEYGYALHEGDVFFEGSLLNGEGRIAGGPAFAVDED